MPPTTTTPKTVDVSDLYAAGIDLTEMLLSAEIYHEPEVDELGGQPLTEREHLALVAGSNESRDDDDGGVVVDLLDTASERCTDLGNARILVRLAGGDIRWCQSMPGEGWMLWDGSKWRPDGVRRVNRLADMVAEEWRRRAPPESSDLVLDKAEKDQKEMRKIILAHANKCESAAGYRNMLEMLKSRERIAVPSEAWDADPLLVNTPDSTYNLRSGRRYAPRRSDHITRSTATAATLDDCPVWRAFLLRIMGGPRVGEGGEPTTEACDAAYADPANAEAVSMVAFLQRAAGYALTGDASEQCMFIAYGTGGNGKGVFLNTLKAILGTYAQGAGVESFVDRKTGGIPNDLAAMAGARFILCSEPEENAPIAEGLIKTCTGQDTVTARFLNREFFDFIPQFKLWMMTNHKPVIKGTDNGIWRRLRLVPFDVKISDEEKDTELPNKIKAEHPAILRWMIEGLKAWRQGGLRPPAPVVRASDIYRREMDVLADFIEDRCEVNSLESAENTALYASYVEWAKDNGLRPRSHIAFTRALTGRGFTQDASRKNGRRWKGLALTVKARQAAFGGGGEDRGDGWGR
jgi:putative DNA primase/helicase